MSDDIEGPESNSSGQTAKSYEEAREFLEAHDRKNLIDLASDEASFPEMLYYLSTDDDHEIRTVVAENTSTPIQADEVLSRDTEPTVRQAIGAKVARHLVSFTGETSTQNSAAIAILEYLIEDEEVRVRRIIAEEVKSSDKIPLNIIQKLARDIDELVSTPILHHSPILDDEELIAIIEDTASSAQLKAIAERREVSEPLAECIIETADVSAISHLLLNPSAQIRENTLDQLINSAKQISDWHEPLVIRPKLPLGAVRKIAEFVAGSMIEILSQRNDIDDELRAELEERVHQRLGDESSQTQQHISEPLDVIERKLRQLDANGGLTEGYLNEHLDRGDRNIIIIALAILADTPPVISRRIFISKSAKAIMSLGWKAGVSAPLVAKMQSTVAHLPADDWVLPNDDESYPFTIREMEWQLALFLEQEENALVQDLKNIDMSDDEGDLSAFK